RDAYSLLRWSSDDYSVATELAVKAVVHQMKFLEVRVTTIYYSEKQDLRILDGVKFMFLMFYWKFKFL
ncbi:MAG: hypothetical protein GX817_00855, partial [Elusimicrobia bacterium]|nr:hypothetical protein [Elusimicrobiota bacterium]